MLLCNILYLWEYTNAALKEIKERKRNRAVREKGAIVVFLYPKTVVVSDKHIKDSLKMFQFSRKAPAPPSQCWDIMAQISVDTFRREGVTFVVVVVNIPSRKYYIQVSAIPVRAVYLRVRGRVYHALDSSGSLVPAYHMSHDLLWFSAYHRHDVDIFTGFAPGFILQNQYSSSSSTSFAQAVDCWLFLFRALFFYPIHHIGFVDSQYLSYVAAADPAVVHFDCQFSSLFRVHMTFRVYGVIYAVLLAASAPRSVVSCLDLVPDSFAFRASFPCLFCPFSHNSFFTIKSLFWTLPFGRTAEKIEKIC